MLLFGSMAHKEERFLTPVYPVLCLGAAVTLDTALVPLAGGIQALGLMRRQRAQALCWVAAGLVATGAASISASRSAALHLNFRAPFRVYEALYNYAPDTQVAGPGPICIGKEWYR